MLNVRNITKPKRVAMLQNFIRLKNWHTGHKVGKTIPVFTTLPANLSLNRNVSQVSIKTTFVVFITYSLCRSVFSACHLSSLVYLASIQFGQIVAFKNGFSVLQ